MSIGGLDSSTLLQRMVDAVELVRQRLVRAAGALRNAGVDYAVVGGNAVAAWVATVDRAAVRSTQDVNVMIRRRDFDRTKAALEGAGFVHRRARGLDVFLDDAASSPRQVVRLVFAGELVKPGEPAANPDVSESIDAGGGENFRILNLNALVRIKLTAFRDKDRTHLRDLIDVGLVDPSWTAQLPAPLAERLQLLLDNPDG